MTIPAPRPAAITSDHPEPVPVPDRAGRHDLATAPDNGQRRIPDTWPLQPDDPARIGDYRLLARLGTGGMADVFHAETRSGIPVTVKLLRAGVGPGGAANCEREYRMLSAVDATCAVPALAYGVSTAGPYLVTAHLPGHRCATTLRTGKLSLRRVWQIGAALARVLDTVHACGIVHCDVKPANLLLRDDNVRLIDFGTARYVGQPCSDDDIVECSPGWAAPEQLFGAPATPAVDIFAWGCLLALLATGAHPFAGNDEEEWLTRIRSARPDLSGLPGQMARVVDHAVAFDPRTRPTARELIRTCRAHTSDTGHAGLRSLGGATHPVPDLKRRHTP